MLCGSPVLWPSLVVFDLDFTLWHRPRFRGGPPWVPVDDGCGGVTSSCGKRLDLYPSSRRALLALSGAGVPVAIASRTHRAEWVREWLATLRLEPGGRTAQDVIGSFPVVIQDGPKPGHLLRIHERTGVPLAAMLFFDDNLADVRAVARRGVTSVHCTAANRRREQCGLTDEAFREGLRAYGKLAAAVEARDIGAPKGPRYQVFMPSSSVPTAAAKGPSA